MKKNKNLAAVLLNANLQGDNIGYQFNRDAEQPIWDDTALGYSLKEWESVKFAKIELNPSIPPVWPNAVFL